MTPEEETARRGEPVLYNGRQGTIEWGGVTRPASIYMENGGRIVGVSLAEIIPDPDTARPVWESVTRRK